METSDLYSTSNRYVYLKDELKKRYSFDIASCEIIIFFIQTVLVYVRFVSYKTTGHVNLKGEADLRYKQLLSDGVLT